MDSASLQFLSRRLLASKDELVNIDHLAVCQTRIILVMKVTKKQALSVRCPTCGAKIGEKCELSTGQPRTDPHRDRRLAASEK